MDGSVGIIGFGEVGAVFAASMKERGHEVLAYDAVKSKVEAGVAAFCALDELIAGSTYVLSTVTSREAANVARECLPFLSEGKTYIDLNSTSPSIKREIGTIVQKSGANFVEGAILGAVGVSGARTRILIGGPAGRKAAEFLVTAGLNAEFYSEEIGKASTFKMLRGIFSKGLEALLIELLVSARRAGIEDDLWNDIVRFMNENDFRDVGANWIRSHAVAHARRHDEMKQVLEVMRELRLPAPMTAGTEAVFARSVELRMSEALPAKPEHQDEVIAFLERNLSL